MSFFHYLHTEINGLGSVDVDLTVNYSGGGTYTSHYSANADYALESLDPSKNVSSVEANGVTLNIDNGPESIQSGGNPAHAEARASMDYPSKGLRTLWILVVP